MNDYPSTSYAEYTLISIQPVLYDVSVNGKDSARFNGGHHWKISIKHPKLSKSEYYALDGFLTKVGEHTGFYITLPDRTPQGVMTGTPLINNTGGYAKGISSIASDGWTVSTADMVVAGDLISFSGHEYVYQIVTTASSDVGGNLTLEIEPPLKQAVLDNESITISGVKFAVKRMGKTSYNVAPTYIYDYSLEVETFG